MIFTREQLPDDVDPAETMQLLLKPLPATVGDGQGGHYRPSVCVVVGAQTTFCYGMEVGDDKTAPFELAAGLVAQAKKAYGPGSAIHWQVADPELATALRAKPHLQSAIIEVVKSVEAAEEMLAQMAEHMAPSPIPSPMKQPEVSVERMAAFADAAAIFHAAALWDKLHDDDVIEIARPKAPKGMKLCSIMGAAKQVQGIAFYGDWNAYDQMQSSDGDMEKMTRTPHWAMMFYSPNEMPPDDAELWDNHGLRLTADDQAPILLSHQGSPQSVNRPDAARLAFVEGLCRALGSTTEAEIDSGQWEKKVQTADGSQTYRLRMAQPGLETPGDYSDLSPQEHAMQLCFASTEVSSRQELHMLNKALKLDPDCAEAYNMLARREADVDKASVVYRKAIEAGRRSLGEEPFNDPDYPFWLDVETRPLLRAMYGLAEALLAKGEDDEPVKLLREILRLNRNDNLGARHDLVSILMELKQYDEARQIIEKDYPSDFTPLWPMAMALIEFNKGNEDKAREHLLAVHAINPYVLPTMIDPEDDLQNLDGYVQHGSQSEADEVVDLIQNAWFQDQKSMIWLAMEIPPLVASHSKPRKSTKKKSTKKSKNPKRN